ncbi:hypothetical protein GCM10007147_40800 [Nocardiopsis kunsanensis]|uniref:Uncharacterized protein n=1 Tax=Nocardiopsis kunsanensis TaxID=141693 RepID=A0A918XJG7_9ACTN|nr:hypothetical protein GCM10007147_40800 [Nocardiopsis kunsanensis]
MDLQCELWSRILQRPCGQSTFRLWIGCAVREVGALARVGQDAEGSRVGGRGYERPVRAEVRKAVHSSEEKGR